MGLKSFSTALIVLVAAVLIAIQFVVPRIEIPQHMLEKATIFQEEFLDVPTQDALLSLMKEIKDYPTNMADTSFYVTRREHVGEAVPFDGVACPHPFLVPNVNRTLCVLPGRIDVGRHFITHGGPEGLKEGYDKSVSRLLSFGAFLFSLDKYPLMQELFQRKKFTDAAKSICPADKQVLDPFQFNFIINAPGQTVALHIDGVYFWGADRFSYPQWLLTVMKFSGLFEDIFIDQLQVVAYLHKWQDPEHKRQGSFVYYTNNEKANEVWPIPRAASLVDGSKTVHAATVYRREDGLALDRNKPNKLRYLGDEKWAIDDGTNVLQTLTTDDLRISLVYRARCFKDEQEKERYANQTPEQDLSLDEIFNTLKSDLVKRGIQPKDTVFDLSLQFLDTYVKYPLPDKKVLIPWNYCAIPRVFPAVDPLFKYICD